MHYQLALLALGSLASLASAKPIAVEARTYTSTNYTDPTAVSALDAENIGLIQSLELAPTAVERFQILAADPKQFKFNFAAAGPPAASSGASVVLANRATMPALIGQGISTAMGWLNPCGINVPHIHPRATEFLTVVSGTIKNGFIIETGSGVSQIETDVNTFEGIVLPQGSIHFQFNDNCESAVFISGLDNEDPGVSVVATNFFSLDPEVVNATLGYPEQIDGTNIQQFAKSIPAATAVKVESCLKRCNIPMA